MAERSDAKSFVVTDSAGIRIIESLEPAWPIGTRTLDPDPSLQIGQEAAGPYQFAYLALGLARDDGTFLIGEIGAQEIRVFDSTGRHVTTFGGRGGGPQEFQNIAGIFPYRGDSLAAYDARLDRTVVLDASLRYGRTIVHNIRGNYGAFGLVQDTLLLFYSPGGGYRPDLEPGLQWVRTPIIAVGPENAQDTIAELPDRLRAVRPDGNAPMPQPLHYAIHAASPEGFYWATPDRWEIRFYKPDGTLQRILRRPLDPERVEPGMIQEYIESLLEQERRLRGEEAIPELRRRYEEDDYVDWLPLFSFALVDRDERLWVGESTWPSSEMPKRWSIFAPEGHWLGDIEVPEGLTPLDAYGDTVLAVWRDELDVPYLQVHRIVSSNQ